MRPDAGMRAALSGSPATHPSAAARTRPARLAHIGHRSAVLLKLVHVQGRHRHGCDLSSSGVRLPGRLGRGAVAAGQRHPPGRSEHRQPQPARGDRARRRRRGARDARRRSRCRGGHRRRTRLAAPAVRLLLPLASDRPEPGAGAGRGGPHAAGRRRQPEHQRRRPPRLPVGTEGIGGGQQSRPHPGAAGRRNQPRPRPA